MFVGTLEMYSSLASSNYKHRLLLFIKLFIPLQIKVDITMKEFSDYVIGTFCNQLANQIVINHLLQTFKVLLILFCSGNYHNRDFVMCFK